MKTRSVNFFKLCLILTVTGWAPRLFAQIPTPIPEGKEEANWLLATCSGVGIPGSLQPDEMTLSPCIQNNGVNKIISAFYPMQGGYARCRLGIDECSEFQKRQPFFRIEEEFSCKDGRKNGPYKGSIYHYNRNPNIFGARVEATYSDGKLHGESRHYGFSGKSICYRYQYKNGLLDGKAEKFFANGSINEDANFINGLRHGKATFFDAGGKITATEMYKDGVRDGDAIHYAKNGDGYQIFSYKNGVEIERTTITNGQKTVLNKKQIEEIEKNQLANQARPAPKTSKLFPFIGLSVGYLNEDLTDEQTRRRSKSRASGVSYGPLLTLPVINCKDIACSGYTLNIGGARSLATDNFLYHAELGAGFVAMYMSGYLGAGLRVDGDRLAIQSTMLFGVVLVNYYIRGFAYTDKEGGGGFETGLLFSYPLLGF